MIAPLGLSPLSLILFALIATIAAAIYRMGGQGFGTILAPFAALITPEYTPAAVLLLGVVVTMIGAGLEFREVRLREIAPAVFGRLAGTIPAIWVVGAVAGSHLLGLAVAGVILFGVALSLAGLKFVKTPATLIIAGILSGFMGTLTSVGAAPMAIIYQNDLARASRGTLNGFFLFGVTASFLGLVMAGLVTMHHIWFSALMLPCVLLGIWLAAPLAQRMGGMPLKPISLGLASLGAFLLIGRSLF